MKKNGYSLLEIIFVLGIWSLFILLALPIQFDILEKQEEEKFFQTFKSDLLFIQNMALANNTNIRLDFEPNHTYSIMQKTGEKLVERSIPEDWEIKRKTMQGPIKFTTDGTISNPGSFTIKTKHAEYSIIFPLGKGRCYIEKK